MAKLEDSRQEPMISDVRELSLPAQVRLTDQDNSVVLTDIDIPFGRAVSIMVKWMIAAIPAVILATIIVYGSIILAGLMFALLFGID